MQVVFLSFVLAIRGQHLRREMAGHYGKSCQPCFHRKRRRKNGKAARMASLLLSQFPSGTKKSHRLLSTLGGRMLCFWVVTAEKPESELSYVVSFTLKQAS